MKKKVMLLGLCMMGAFSTVLADESVKEEEVTTTTTPVEGTTASADDEKDCGCKH